MILLYICFKTTFLSFTGLFKDKVVSLIRSEYGSAVLSLEIFIKSLKSISNE